MQRDAAAPTPETRGHTGTHPLVGNRDSCRVTDLRSDCSHLHAAGICTYCFLAECWVGYNRHSCFHPAENLTVNSFVTCVLFLIISFHFTVACLCFYFLKKYFILSQWFVLFFFRILFISQILHTTHITITTCSCCLLLQLPNNLPFAIWSYLFL